MKMSSLVRRIIEKMVDQFEEESDKLFVCSGPITCRNWEIRRIR
jgi:hypothetical protein